MNRRASRRTARRTSRRVNRRQDMMRGAAAPAYEQPAYEAPPPAPAQAPAPAAAAAPGDDLMDQLERLADLKAEGLLSDEEFAAAKAKLLG